MNHLRQFHEHLGQFYRGTSQCYPLTCDSSFVNAETTTTKAPIISQGPQPNSSSHTPSGREGLLSDLTLSLTPSQLPAESDAKQEPTQPKLPNPLSRTLSAKGVLPPDSVVKANIEGEPAHQELNAGSLRNRPSGDLISEHLPSVPATTII